jgi:hypothetical protein
MLQEYADAWAANDAERLADFWDRSDPAPFYKAEEVDEFFADWNSLRAYWRGNEGMHERVELGFSDFMFKPVTADIVIAIFRMRWDILFADTAMNPDGTPSNWRGQAMGGDNHVLALLRQTADGWRLAGWSETPKAPILYIADLYLRNVRPDFIQR